MIRLLKVGLFPVLNSVTGFGRFTGRFGEGGGRLMKQTDRLRVMLSTEGTYPFHQGGVSSWCHILVEGLTDLDYIIYSLVMNPFVTQKFSLPENAGMIKVPLWGTEDPSEHLTAPFSSIYTAKRNTGPRVIEEHFIPLFANLITEIVKPDKNPVRFGHLLAELHKYFKYYDYKNSFKAETTWQVFKDILLTYVADRNSKLAEPSVFDLSQSLGWIFRFLVILNTPLPDVQVTHSAAAGFCGIPCILAKLENKTPYLLTEHGVYLREQYLSLSRRMYSSYLSTFLIRLINSVVSLNYAMADQISPVCRYNTRWETMFGVSPEAIKVIYNGVDRELFSPAPEFHVPSRLTVVSVARVDPNKDLVTLIRAAAIVRQRLPEVKFIVYGSITVPEYYEECLALIHELELEGTFIIAGHTDDTPSAYRSGNIIALSSISEAFPYAVVEAMMSGKPVVATDVGGVREALGDCGVIVKPRRPEEFAQALIKLLEDPELCASLGRDARERALNYFTIERMLEVFLDTYRQLARVVEPRVAAVNLRRQKLLAEKGCALAELGYWREAIAQFRSAIEAAAGSPAVPTLLLETARAYNNLGEFELAFAELEKAHAVFELIQGAKAVKSRTAPITLKQRLLLEKGYVLAEFGYWQEAITQFRLAVKAAVDSAAVSVIMLEIARAFNNLGEYELAFRELEKAEAVFEIFESTRPESA